MSNASKSPFEILVEKTEAKLSSLQLEREARLSNDFPSDVRIATEIAATQFELGECRKIYREQIVRWQKGCVQLKGQIATINALSAKLQRHLDVALHKERRDGR